MDSENLGELDIRMLGGFTIYYRGQEIALGRSSTAKFIQLLQIVWLHKERGISKEQIMNSLYDRENVSNINNSLNICNQDGLCVIDDSIEVKVDAVDFVSLIKKEDSASSEEEKARFYGQAAKLYRGELLPAISTETWVMILYTGFIPRQLIFPRLMTGRFIRSTA